MILIKNLDAADSCRWCPFREHLFCNAMAGKKIADEISQADKPDWCPIVMDIPDDSTNLEALKCLFPEETIVILNRDENVLRFDSDIFNWLDAKFVKEE